MKNLFILFLTLTLSSSTLFAEDTHTETLSLFYHQEMLMQRINKSYAAITLGFAKKLNEEQIAADAVELAENLGDLEIYAPTAEMRQSVKTVELLWARHYEMVSEAKYSKTALRDLLMNNKELLEANEEVENQLVTYITTQQKEATPRIDLLQKIGAENLAVQQISTLFFAHLAEVDYDNLIGELGQLVINYEVVMIELLEATEELPSVKDPLLGTLTKWEDFEKVCANIKKIERTGLDYSQALGGSTWISNELEQIMTMLIDTEGPVLASD
ncbi:MAG: hypothetical protein GY810_21015 [Aureispira sp.]|nr:hypothetical protein [Aureispira sp.]